MEKTDRFQIVLPGDPSSGKDTLLVWFDDRSYVTIQIGANYPKEIDLESDSLVQEYKLKTTAWRYFESLMTVLLGPEGFGTFYGKEVTDENGQKRIVSFDTG
jgi:hypothetical protein